MFSPDQRQLEIIKNTKDNIVLYASAGTGKTFTVANKIAYYLNENICDDKDILCLTFTVKACKELVDDIKKFSSKDKNVLVKTIHGFCYKIVNEESSLLNEKYVQPIICDEIDTDYILYEKILPLLNEKNFENILKSRGANHDLNWLKSKDVYYDNNNDSFYYVVDVKDGYFLINYQGKSLKFSDNSFFNRKSGAVCPECKKIQEVQGNVCVNCGFDFRKYVPPFKTHVPSLRNFVSFIKRQRVILNVYSNSEMDDYQRVFDYLYSKDSTKIEKMLSFKDNEIKKFISDIPFLDAMKKYCGFFISSYNDYLLKTNRIDYDDMIIRASELFKKEDVLLRQAKYKFIVIDEMQDTSELEYFVLKNLFNCQIMMCGDTYQSIYKWRGAKPNEIITEFCEDFNVVEYFLEKNYRATQTLIEFANAYLNKAFNQKNKIGKIEEKFLPKIVECQTRLEEANYVLSQIKSSHGSSAILTRTNNYANDIYLLLKEIDPNLSFVSYEEEQRLLKSKVVKNFLSLLKLYLNPFDDLNFEQITQEFIPNLGEAYFEKLNLPLIGICSSIFLKKEIYEGSDPYINLINSIANGKLVVFDVETSSLDIDGCEIIQLSAYRADGQEFNCFIKNTCPLEDSAVQVHGYNQEFLDKNGQELLCVLEKFSEFCNGCVIVGHNSQNFDLPIVTRVMRENKINFEFIEHYDTLILSKMLLPNQLNYKLSTLCEVLSIINERAHDAFSDVKATFDVLKYIIKKLKETALIRNIVIKKHTDKFKEFSTAFNELKNEKELMLFLLKTKKYLLKNTFKDQVLANDYLDRIIKKFNISTYDDIQDLPKKFREFDENVKNTYSESAIPVITIHQAKGMEFDNVFLVGMDNFTFPDDTTGIDNEQRRVLYVAITRAKNKLYITNSAKDRYGKNIQKSALLSFLPIFFKKGIEI